jgi:hypothetical protein
MRIYRGLWTTSIISMVSAISCAPSLPIGHFEGSIYFKTAAKTIHQPVRIDITHSDKKTLKFDIDTIQNQRLMDVIVNRLTKDQFFVYLNEISPDPIVIGEIFQFKTESNQKCVYGSSKVDIQFCFDPSSFLLQIASIQQAFHFELRGSQFLKEEDFVLEPPMKISLSDAVLRGYKYSFESRLGLEQIFQAKNNALAAYLNLIPHINANLIWNTAPGYTAVIATLPAGAPFLLPNYWLQTIEAKVQMRIEADALRIVRANVINAIEDLFFNYIRDIQIKKAHLRAQEFLHSKSTTQISKMIKDIDFVLDANVYSLKALLKKDQIAMAKVLGLHNPEAIEELVLDRDPFIPQSSKPLNSEMIAMAASRRSFELQQIEYLIEIAKYKTFEMFFSWIDTSSDYRQSLGFNLIPQLRVHRSQTKQLNIKREQIKSLIYQSAYQIVDDYNHALEAYYYFDKQTVRTEEMLMNQLQLSYLSYAQEPDSLRTSIQNAVYQYVQYETNLATLRIAQAKLNQLLLIGPYEKLTRPIHTAPPDLF